MGDFESLRPPVHWQVLPYTFDYFRNENRYLTGLNILDPIILFALCKNNIYMRKISTSTVKIERKRIEKAVGFLSSNMSF